MSKEPINLVFEQLKLLRGDVLALKESQNDMRADLREVRLIQAKHTLSLDFLTERVEKLREGTLTAIGFAAETGAESRSIVKQVADLTKRVAKLEKA